MQLVIKKSGWLHGPESLYGAVRWGLLLTELWRVEGRPLLTGGGVAYSCPAWCPQLEQQVVLETRHYHRMNSAAC